MNKEQILKELQAKNKNLRLPSGMGFSIEDKVLTIRMEENGLTSNMQTDTSAFEGWAICLKAWLPEYISEVKIEGGRPSVKEKSKEERHYNRFLYRLNKFIEIYSWVSTTDDFKHEIKKIFNEKTDLYINVPRQDASKGATHCEAQLERAFRKKNEGSYCTLDHQLPVRIFSNKETKEKDAITPGGFIDIWGITDDCLKIFELKLPVNKEIGIISELMFYVNVMTDIFQHKIAIPRESQYRSFDQLKEFYEKKWCKRIEGVFLADNFHSMIENKKEDVLQIINDGEFVRDTSQLSVFFSFNKPNVKDYCPTHLEINEPKKNMTYKECQKIIQLRLLKQADGIFEDAKGCGKFDNNMYPYVLQEKDSQKNLFKAIRGNVEKYFDDNAIAWWNAKKGLNMPTGHLLSSQINCLNHLFALREDKDALLSIINNATKMDFDEVLPSLIDDDGYLSFEFAYKNDDLIGEKDKCARRGYMWTSIDAMIIARKGKDKWLIPIEWKYTETYEKEDKTCQKRLDRYEELIKKSDRLKMPENGQIPHSIYFQEPSYELMRQTLLCEQLIRNKYADDFFHINIIPKENTELREAVEHEFMPMLTKESKFAINDPQDLLSPVCDNKKYEDLITYLETRYWK